MPHSRRGRAIPRAAPIGTALGDYDKPKKTAAAASTHRTMHSCLSTKRGSRVPRKGPELDKDDSEFSNGAFDESAQTGPLPVAVCWNNRQTPTPHQGRNESPVVDFGKGPILRLKPGATKRTLTKSKYIIGSRLFQTREIPSPRRAGVLPSYDMPPVKSHRIPMPTQIGPVYKAMGNLQRPKGRFFQRAPAFKQKATAPAAPQSHPGEK